jgi:hypothetical protein
MFCIRIYYMGKIKISVGGVCKVCSHKHSFHYGNKGCTFKKEGKGKKCDCEMIGDY